MVMMAGFVRIFRSTGFSLAWLTRLFRALAYESVNALGRAVDWLLTVDEELEQATFDIFGVELDFPTWIQGGSIRLDLMTLIQNAVNKIAPEEYHRYVNVLFDLPQFQGLDLSYEFDLPSIFELMGTQSLFDSVDWSDARDWYKVIFKDGDLVPIQLWLDSAAGYICEPGMFGSEFIDDIMHFIIPQYGVLDIVGDVMSKYREIVLEYNTYASKYNEFRASILSFLTRAGDLIADVLHVISYGFDQLGNLLPEDVVWDDFIAWLTELSADIIDTISEVVKTMPLLPIIPEPPSNEWSLFDPPSWPGNIPEAAIGYYLFPFFVQDCLYRLTHRDTDLPAIVEFGIDTAQNILGFFWMCLSTLVVVFLGPEALGLDPLSPDEDEPLIWFEYQWGRDTSDIVLEYWESIAYSVQTEGVRYSGEIIEPGAVDTAPSGTDDDDVSPPREPLGGPRVD
jgi:hypothetical protein